MTDVPETKRNGLFRKNDIQSVLSSQRSCVAENKPVEGFLFESRPGDERHSEQGISDSNRDYQPFVRRARQRPERNKFYLLEEHQINEDDDDDNYEKVTTKRWIMHGAVMFGREFCYAIETALVAPTLLKIGLPEQYYSLTWFLSPVLSLLFSPLIGSASDRCTSRWGRRRPFILILSCGVLLGVTLFLNGASLGRLIRSETTSWWCCLVFTVFGVVFMDFCADSTESPIRAYLLDVAQGEDQDMALNIHAAATGLGGAMGYAVGGIKWTHTFLGEMFSSQQQIIFLFTTIIFTTSVALHLFSIPEKPLVTTRNVKSHKQPHCQGVVAMAQTKETTRDVVDTAAGEPLGKRREQKASCFDATVTRCRSEPVLNSWPQPVTRPRCFDCSDAGDRKTIARIGKPFSHCNNDGTLCTTLPFPVPQEGARNSCIREKNTASNVVFGESLIIHCKCHRRIYRWTHMQQPETFSGSSDLGMKCSSGCIHSTNHNVKNLYNVPSTHSLHVCWPLHRQVCPRTPRIHIKRSLSCNVYDSSRSQAAQQRSSAQNLNAQAMPGSGACNSLEEGCDTNGLHEQLDDDNSVRVLWKSMRHLPRELWRLCICNLFTWFTLLTFSLGYTDFMGQTVYGGKPTAPDNSTDIDLYNSGVQMGCWGLVFCSSTTSVLSGSLELSQSDHRVLGHLSYQGSSPPTAQICRAASSRKSPGCSKLLPFKNYGGHCALGNLQCSRDFFLWASPDLCLDTILSLSSAGSSFDLMAWFLL
uniref:solute carrier family 45 member 4-like isoform X2 n=1 Tax=Myxine glutinosa TaxID=7769 RepID=UPI00358F3A5E